jgi:hypothetical protein
MTSGPVPGKIKINITTLPSVIAKESQSEGDVEMLSTDQSTDNGHGPVIAEAIQRMWRKMGTCRNLLHLVLNRCN